MCKCNWIVCVVAHVRLVARVCVVRMCVVQMCVCLDKDNTLIHPLSKQTH